MSNNFRDLLPDLSAPHMVALSERTAEQHADALLAFPLAAMMIDIFKKRHTEPFRGVTSDGKIIPGLYSLADEGAPVAEMVDAATKLIAVMDEDESMKARQDIDSFTWRNWGNGEVYFDRFGLRLDQTRAPVVEAVLALMEASMSPEGFEKARNCMRTNDFLGELVNAPQVMNEFSYNFMLYGDPSSTEPWGWNFYGHHLCLNCFLIGGQMVISPTFMGAEPNQIDDGPFAGTEVLKDEEYKGLELIRSLPSELRDAAQMNGFLIHALDFDDTHVAGVIHATCTAATA